MTTKKTFGKRAISLLLTLLMVLSLVPVSLFSAFASEIETVAASATATPYDGVPVAPEKITSSNYQSFGLTDSNWSAYNGYYGIRNAKELYGFANLVNNGENSANAVVLNDIVVNETVKHTVNGATYDWKPIGNVNRLYKGVFDGNGCTISGLYFNESDYDEEIAYIGLFGVIDENTTIKNIILSNTYFHASARVAGIVAHAYKHNSVIDSCVLTDSVVLQVSVASEYAYTGGFIGSYTPPANMLNWKNNTNYIKNCVNLGKIYNSTAVFDDTSSHAWYYTGSIAGSYRTDENAYDHITAENCYYLKNSITDKYGNTDTMALGGTNLTVSSDRGCTSLNSASDSHTCVSVNHTEIKATCLYSGLSEYSECLICGAVMSGAKIVYGIDYENHASIDVIYENIDTANHKVYHNCCGALKTTEKHNFNGKATCNTAATCNSCGGVSDLNKDNHTGNLKYTYKNETHHSVLYSCCEAFVEDKEHTYSGGNCVTKEVCEICEGEGSICTDIHASTEIYWNVVTKDHTKHAQYHKCCDEEIENTTAEHEFEDSKCRICRYECEHPNMDDGICTDCGENSVKYLDRTWNGTTVVTTEKNTIGMPTTVTSSTTAMTLTSGWYMVTGEVTVDANINISGTVHLILMDGATLRATYGVALTGGNTLYIYATSDDPNTMGKLDASTSYAYRASIGSNDYRKSAGTLVINGGTVIAKGTGAGIGGYCSTSNPNRSNNDFNLIVNGGFIQAQGGSNSAGIGSSYTQTGGKITINGGTVIAKGGSSAAGIGGGNGSSGERITINGGTVTATGEGNGSGIGRGNSGSQCTITINGGNIKAVAGRSSGSFQTVAISGTPTDGKGNNVYLNTITLDGVTEQKAVTEVKGVESYGFNDVKTLDTNMLYFYLPETDNLKSVDLEENRYVGTLAGTTEKSGTFILHNEHEWSGYCDTACNACGEKRTDTAEHTYSSDCDEDCNICEEVRITDTLHNSEKGECTLCGKMVLPELVEEYYQIYNAYQLCWFADFVNAGNPDANAVLMSDIDLANKDWKVVCETGLYYSAYGEDLGYAGTFDGNGHTIKNLTVTSSKTKDASCGLFGTVSGVIKNLGVDGFIFQDGGYDIRAGAIVGQLITAKGKVENCYVKNATIDPGEHVAGGIAGCVYDGTIENCYVVESTITGTSGRFGHIVGDSRADRSTTDRRGTVINCYADNTPYGSGNVGYITNCETKTSEQFKSGEVAYLLQGTQTEEIWGQKIGTDTYPVLGGDKVYYVTNCKDENIYSNKNENGQHNFVDGTCKICGLTNVLLSEINLLKIYIERFNTTADENNVLESKKEPLNDIYQALLAVNMPGGSGSVASRLDLIKIALVTYNEQFQNGIADGTWVKADYTEIDAAVAEIESVGATTDKMSAKIEEIKSEISVMKESSETSKADVAVLMKEVEVLKDCVSGNHIFENGKCTICGMADPNAKDELKGYTIGLGDKIAVNYYMSLTEKTVNDANAKIVFTVPDTGSTYTVEIPVSSVTPNKDGFYVFTCEVAAKEMTSVISAKLVTSEGELMLKDYTVQDYAKVILENPETYAKEQALVKAMLNYGAQAQIYFNYNTDKLANNTELMTDEEKIIRPYGFPPVDVAYSITGEEAGVTYYGTALSLEAELEFKHYFIVDESVDAQSLEITCDYPVSFKKNGSLYELKISDIPAHKMAESSLKVTIGGVALDYTIYSYGAKAYEAGKDELFTIVSALTHFANEATAYTFK